MWDVATGEELCSLIHLDGDDWLATTPDGFFDGSMRGREKVGYRVAGLEVVPVDRFFQDFYRPGLLAALWKGERPRPEAKLGGQKPPTLRIVSPADGLVTDNTEVTVEAEATDEGGGITGPWLVHNGARVRGESRTSKQGKLLHRAFTLTLAPGANRVEVRAASADGSWESEPAKVSVRVQKLAEKVALHVLAVGINNYAETSLNLKFAAADAKAVSDLFRNRGRDLFKEGEFRTLLDGDATQEKIHDAVRGIARAAKPEDVLVVFLAGHGTALGQRYYYVPADFKRTDAPSIEDDVRKQGLAGDVLASWLEEVRATKRIIILDTCQSGAALGKSGGRNPFAFQGAIETLRRSNGAHTIAAAAAGEEAKEVEELGHGLLTYTLLAGLKAVDRGPLADKWIKPSNPEEVVDVFEWFSYASGQVPRIADRYFKARQNVSVNSADNIFPVLPLKGR
jgi:predicted GNAT family acetyltransferase